MNDSQKKVNYQRPVLIKYGTVIKATRSVNTSAFFNQAFFPGDLIQGSGGGGGGDN